MAQRMTVTLEDDLDGGKADETVRFGIDGVDYEIDLSKKNAKTLRDVIQPYADAGRKVTGRRRGGRGGGKNTRASSDTAQIREWAAANGYQVSDRGRVPNSVREAYDEAH